MNRLKSSIPVLTILLGLGITITSCNPDQVLYDTGFVPGEEAILLSDRVGWSVVSFTSEETSGEGETGRASDILDGSLDTFWHSCWTCDPAVDYNHEIVIDMGSEFSVAGLQYTHRQGGGRGVKAFEVQLSMDNTTFTSVGEFETEDGRGANGNDGPQDFNFESSTGARYIKLILKSAHDDATFAAISEINAFITVQL